MLITNIFTENLIDAVFSGQPGLERVPVNRRRSLKLRRVTQCPPAQNRE
jgi:hypothetical protein